MYMLKVITIVAISSAITAVLGSDLCPSQPAVTRSCPPMWQLWRDACYRLTESQATWDDSWSACRSMGGKMAAPRSLEEMEFMAELARNGGGDKYTAWIACNDKDVECTWVCEGQEGSEPFLNWYDGQPDDDENNQDCVVISANHGNKMDDQTCSENKQALCVRQVAQPRRYCFSTDTHGRIPNSTCLLDHVILEFVTHSVSACGSACVEEPGCRSFNIKKTQDGKKKCQLNNSTSSEDSANFQNTGYFCIYSEVYTD